MKIAIIGTGYVGLVTGVCLADFGHNVTCVDKDCDKIESLENCELPIYEPGLESLLAKNKAAGRLSFTTDLEFAVAKAKVVFIAVGTPKRPDNDDADLTHVMSAAREVAGALKNYAVIAMKSTVPIGTNRKVAQALREAAQGLKFDVVSNPEFLREGAAVSDFMKPDRVIVGTESDRAQKTMAEIYRPLYLRNFPIVYTDLETAETIKYASNAFLATKITFINEVAALCEAVDADVTAVAHGMGLDNRIGSKFLHAGPGYGGSCFPKDTLSFARIGQKFGAPQLITEAVIQANEKTKQRMVKKIIDLCAGSVDGLKITILGVTFKPETDDMRDAPSLAIIPALMNAGAQICVVDPQGQRQGSALLPGVTWIADPYVATKGADCLIILTEWNAFRALNLKDIAKSMKTPRLADFRNIYNPKDVFASGFTAIESVGRVSKMKSKNIDDA